MPERARVEAFIAMVVSNQHVQAIENFYWEDASMQENGQPPRRGRDVLVAHESNTMKRVERMYTHPDPTFLIDGDLVAVQWHFEATEPGGHIWQIEEVALQRWRGDRIAEERFFYDPTNVRARPAPT